MRGFNTLKKEGKLDFITIIKNDLSNIVLNCNSTNSSSLVFGAGKWTCELVLRQFLVEKVLSLEFNKELLRSMNRPEKEIKHPLPPEWRSAITEHGFKAKTLTNKLLWQRFLLGYFFLGIATICANFFQSLRSIFDSKTTCITNYAYFQALSSNNFPVVRDDGRVSHDIISWYYQWNGKAADITTLCHSVKNVQQKSMADLYIRYTPSAIPPLDGLIQFGAYLFWGSLVTAISFIDLFRGRYWHALLLRESAKAGQIRLVKPGNLAKEYLFHNSNHIYRPLWTYDAEQMGSRILFYFYSTNIESFKTSNGYPLQENIWNILSWSNYLVWDSYQADFIRRWTSENDKIHIVGSIWFSTSKKELPDVTNKKTIAVFDVQPVRDSFYQILGQSNGFNIPEVANLFLRDIYEAVDHCGYQVLFKRKRNAGSLIHKKYSKALSELTNKDSFTSLDPDIPAFRVIERSDAVISMAFTSTAIIAMEFEKPSIFYDPVGMLQLDDRAAHGIPIIVGKENLIKWVESVFDSK